MRASCLPVVVAVVLSAPQASAADELAVQGTEIEKLILDDGKLGDQFGRAVAIHGDRLVVTSSEKSSVGPDTRRGAAYVYQRSPTGWGLEQRLEAFDTEEFDFFGWSTAFDGTTIAVGARNKTNAFGDDGGAAYTFVQAPSGWVSQGKLLPSQGSPDALFGEAVDVDGDSLIVGAPREDNGGFSFRGAAYIFVRRNGVWTEEARLEGDPVGFLFFGSAVAIRGDVAMVSSVGFDGLYVFERSGTTWSLVDHLQPEIPAAGFGEDIDFDGQTLWVGASGDQQTGSIHSYVFDGQIWVPEQQVFAADAYQFQNFGHQVDVEGDWGVAGILVGQGGRKATIHVLHRSGGVWSDVGSFCASDDFTGLDFGWSLAFDGATVLSGALRGLGNAVLGPSGAAYVHVLDLPPTTHCTAEPHSEGCVATIAWNGNASLSDPSPFDVAASDVVTSRNGLFFYGLSGPAELPFQGGTLCVQPPLRRTTVQTSGGVDGVPCDGAFTFDVNAWLQAGSEPLATPGLQVDGQYWFRDSGAPAGVGLTDSVRFFVNP